MKPTDSMCLPQLHDSLLASHTLVLTKKHPSSPAGNACHSALYPEHGGPEASSPWLVSFPPPLYLLSFQVCSGASQGPSHHPNCSGLCILGVRPQTLVAKASRCLERARRANPGSPGFRTTCFRACSWSSTAMNSLHSSCGNDEAEVSPSQSHEFVGVLKSTFLSTEKRAPRYQAPFQPCEPVASLVSLRYSMILPM